MPVSNNERYRHKNETTNHCEELTFKMQWSDNVMSDELEVLMSKPLLDVPLSTREKVINNSDFMSH